MFFFTHHFWQLTLMGYFGCCLQYSNRPPARLIISQYRIVLKHRALLLKLWVTVKIKCQERMPQPFIVAKMIAVSSSLFIASTSAPLAISSCTISKCPLYKKFKSHLYSRTIQIYPIFFRLPFWAAQTKIASSLMSVGLKSVSFAIINFTISECSERNSIVILKLLIVSSWTYSTTFYSLLGCSSIELLNAAIQSKLVTNNSELQNKHEIKFISNVL